MRAEKTARPGERLMVTDEAATLDGAPLPLGRMELRVLGALAAARGKPVSLARLLRVCWNDDSGAATKVWSVISRLRARLRGSSVSIEVDRDVGYRLVIEGARGGLLLIEDEPIMQRAIARVLESIGEVTLASSMTEALALLPTRRWAAIFIDVGLPDGCGLQVLARARQLDPEVPAMVITARTDEVALREASGLGALYVVKPVSPAALRAFARGAVNG